MAGMWTYLAPWIVQDGGLPEIYGGSVLPRVGLAITGRLVASGPVPEPGVVVAQEPFRYVVSGVASRAVDVRVGAGSGTGFEHVGTEFVLDCGDLAFRAVAEGASVSDIDAGQRRRVSGQLTVLPGYEVECSELDLARTVRNWRVRAVHVQSYELAWTSRGADGGLEGRTVATLDRVEIERVDAWPDEERFRTEPTGTGSTSISFSYLLDLEPAP